jgi:pSer/pThr/pTyr-binding forkhead associated (FHA) protein
MSNLAKTQMPEYTLTVMNGPTKGTQYKLSSGSITIGRSDDNHIVIRDDPKMSRNHAKIDVQNNLVEISNLNERNKIFVNDLEVNKVALNPDSNIVLGNTKFQLSYPRELANQTPKNLAPQINRQVPMQHSAAPQPARSKPSGRSRNSQNSKLNFYIIIGVVAVLLIWLLSSNITKKKDVTLRTEDDIQQVITSNNKLLDEVESDRNRSGTNTQQFAEAQPNFVKGFRDYRKGQYERAIESFQACLSLFPNHIQCRTYLSKSQSKFSELVQYHMILAARYRAQNQYSSCKASYRNVLDMIKNPNDIKYQEAKSGFDACSVLEGVRY